MRFTFEINAKTFRYIVLCAGLLIIFQHNGEIKSTHLYF
jgi:hypothetical protein